MTAPPQILRTVEQLDGEWLARTLGSGPVASFRSERIGTGQMSESHRVSLRYADEQRAGPASVVVKLAACEETSRSTGVGLGIYAREVEFYRSLAPRVSGPIARCRLAAYEPAEGWFTLVLEDVAPAQQGDQVAGCSPQQARLAISELARLHAPVLGDESLERCGWLNRPSPVDRALVSALLGGCLERYGERLDAEQCALCERFVEALDGWLAERTAPLGLVHGDYRLDNLLFGEPGSPRPLTVVDWQTVGWGGALHDASYLLGGSLSVKDRRAHERELLREYHARLASLAGVRLDWEWCWREYRRHAFAGVLMAIVAPMIVERTARGDEMFSAMLARHCQHALDLDACELLPAAPARPPAPRRPAPEDEHRHAAGAERLWNESWYFDAISEDGAIGAYVRVGLYPNLGVCWYTAFVCGPGRAGVAVVDYAAPLPHGETLRLEREALSAEHACDAPLEHFRVTLDGLGEAHADPSAPLRGEPGRAQRVALALSWRTDGDPYAYRLATRYEIPCLVSGTISVDGETFVLRDAPGQRDHSWGVRDWWAMDWVWSAGRLEDGTRLHAVELRLSEEQRLSVGYVQSPGQPLLELAHLAAREQLAEDGLIRAAQLSLLDAGIELEVEPLAFGALRLVAQDGRVAHFPRAMCRIESADGRRGMAWVEWNRNQPRAAERMRRAGS